MDNLRIEDSVEPLVQDYISDGDNQIEADDESEDELLQQQK